VPHSLANSKPPDSWPRRRQFHDLEEGGALARAARPSQGPGRERDGGRTGGHKDRTLLSTNPHLALDGAQYLAALIGARRVAVCVSRKDSAIVHHVHSLHERERRGGGPEFILHTPPWRYVAGEESALVHWLNDNETMPQYDHSAARAARRSLPALVVNAETCAHVGLINRFGAHWFRELGTPSSPGSALVSVSGAVRRPTVLEVALGTPLRSILREAGADPIRSRYSPAATAVRGSTANTSTPRTPTNLFNPRRHRRRRHTRRGAQGSLRARRDPAHREVDGE